MITTTTIVSPQNIRRLLVVTGGLAVLSVVATGGLALRQRTPAAGELAAIPDQATVVVTTTFPLYDFTRTVAADVPGIVVRNLTPLNVGPHDFSPTPETSALVARAKLVVRNGLGIDAFADRLIAAGANPSVAVVNTGLGTQTVPAGDGPGVDPHVWLNPRNAAAQVQQIRDALIALDPAHKTAFEQNAGRYVSQLNQLDQSFERTLAETPVKKFVAFHNAFRHLTTRYGLEQVGVFETAPGTEPSAKDLADLTEVIQAQKLRTIFSEPQFSPQVVESLANDLGLTVRPLDPIETAADERSSYLGLMRTNLEQLRQGLR